MAHAWATKAGGGGGDSGQKIASLEDGSSITGYFERRNFGSTNSQALEVKMFIAKLNPDGSYMGKKCGGSGADMGRDINLSDGSSIITGNFEGTANFEAPVSPVLEVQMFLSPNLIRMAPTLGKKREEAAKTTVSR